MHPPCTVFNSAAFVYFPPEMRLLCLYMIFSFLFRPFSVFHSLCSVSLFCRFLAAFRSCRYFMCSHVSLRLRFRTFLPFVYFKFSFASLVFLSLSYISPICIFHLFFYFAFFSLFLHSFSLSRSFPSYAFQLLAFPSPPHP